LLNQAALPAGEGMTNGIFEIDIAAGIFLEHVA
jgi:hypothetical protein